MEDIVLFCFPSWKILGGVAKERDYRFDLIDSGPTSKVKIASRYEEGPYDIDYDNNIIKNNNQHLEDPTEHCAGRSRSDHEERSYLRLHSTSPTMSGFLNSIG